MQNKIKIKLKKTNENYEIGNKIKYDLKEKKGKNERPDYIIPSFNKGSYAYLMSKQF